MLSPTFGKQYPTLASLLQKEERYPTLATLIEADFKTSEKKFLDQGIALEEIKNYFDQFKTLKPRIPEAEKRDIDQWAKQDWEKFKTFIDELKGTKSKSEIKKLEKMEGAELVTENDGWFVYHITSHAASRRYGSNTKWCITQPSSQHFDNYIKTNNFYFLISKIKRTSPWNKIAVQVNEAGQRTYWDETDASHKSLPPELKIPDFEVEKVTFKIVISGQTFTLEEFQKADGLIIGKKGKLTDLSNNKLPEGVQLEFPTNLTVLGDLKVPKNQVLLAPGLTVMGLLNLAKTQISNLPTGLKVGSLSIYGLDIETLPPDIKIKKDLNAEFSSLKVLPPLKLTGDLTLSDTPLGALPEGLQVGGELDIMDTSIIKLPKKIKVGIAIFVDDPDTFEVSKNLKELIH